MHAAFDLILVGSFTFVGTMVDSFWAFAAQLSLTARDRFPRVTAAQSAAFAVLVGLAAGVGASLAVLPVRWVAVAALVPWVFAWRRWRRRREEARGPARRGTTTTFLLTLGLGGESLAVWIPLARANGVVHQLVLGAVFASWQGIFIGLSWALASHPRVVGRGQRAAGYLVPCLYVALGFVILAECRVL